MAKMVEIVHNLNYTDSIKQKSFDFNQFWLHVANKCQYVKNVAIVVVIFIVKLNHGKKICSATYDRERANTESKEKLLIG